MKTCDVPRNLDPHSEERGWERNQTSDGSTNSMVSFSYDSPTPKSFPFSRCLAQRFPRAPTDHVRALPATTGGGTGGVSSGRTKDKGKGTLENKMENSSKCSNHEKEQDIIYHCIYYIYMKG